MEIHIEFGETDPPEGRTRREGHPGWLTFAGWLELISAIERQLESVRRAPAEPTDRGHGG